jgi:hypothetical protein
MMLFWPFGLWGHGRAPRDTASMRRLATVYALLDISTTPIMSDMLAPPHTTYGHTALD